MKRRTFITTAAGATAVGLAGCTVSPTDDDDDDPTAEFAGPEERAEMDFSGETLIVATYDSFIDAPSDSPGEWIKDEFEERYDVDFEWEAPEQELTHYVEQHNAGVDIDADLYLGVRPQNLVRADGNLEGEMLAETDIDLLRNGADIGEQYFFDPHDRAVPTFLSHNAIVYDGRNVPEPETFEDLTSDTYEGKIALGNPSSSTTGLLFMLWTIHEFGEDGYLEYWSELTDNDVTITDSWGEKYTLFEEDERPVVVSYSNDRVYAKRFGNPMDKHQVALLNDQGYANMAGVARFPDSDNPDLAHEFIDFLLEPEVQSVIAERNVTGPVNETAEPPEVFQEYAEEPDETVFFGYEELEGNLEEWIDDWSREVAIG